MPHSSDAASAQEDENIEPGELAQRLRRGDAVRLVDVRDPVELFEGRTKRLGKRN